MTLPSVRRLAITAFLFAPLLALMSSQADARKKRPRCVVPALKVIKAAQNSGWTIKRGKKSRQTPICTLAGTEIRAKAEEARGTCTIHFFSKTEDYVGGKRTVPPLTRNWHFMRLNWRTLEGRPSTRLVRPNWRLPYFKLVITVPKKQTRRIKLVSFVFIGPKCADWANAF